MADTAVRRPILGQLIFAGISVFLLFLTLIPLETVPPSLGGRTLEPLPQDTPLAGAATDIAAPDEGDLNDPIRLFSPDLMLLVALAWVARRPSFAPAIVIAVLFLLADMLLQRPPGLWAALVLILSEILRGRARSIRTLPFWLEWATVAVGILAIAAIYRFTLSMVLVPQGPLGLTLLQLIFTIACYPAVVVVSYFLFGLRRPAPGETDAYGHRL